jgi:hypothetical protein
LFFFCLLACVCTFFTPANAIGQEPEYEEILVSVNIQGMGTIEVPALINEQTLFLPIVDIFDYLKIKMDESQNSDTISGFFISQDNKYLIDRVNSKIFLSEKEFQLPPKDLIKTETALYMKRDHFGSVFDLPSAFNFRALLVNMSSKNELPVMREARLESIRSNVRRLKGEISADTTLKRLDPWIHFGMTDWSVIAAQQSDGIRDTRVNLGLGGIALGGEVNASLNYSTSVPFQEKQQFYSWRYVNNEAKTVKQVVAGKIPTMTVASIFAPVLGVTVTNTPTIAKRAFGSYRLSNITEPNWVVELYVNNILVDYVRADETGFFSFNVPLVYGNSAIKLRYYGPFGEERAKDENISIPFNFMSPGKFEYLATAGVVEDDTLSRLGRGGITYGLNRYVTLGTGIEYLSSVKNNPVMPYINGAVRLGNGILMFGEYNYKVRAKGGLFYRTVSNWQFEASYSLYEKGQKAINNNAEQERRAVVSVPLRFKRLSMFSMLTFNQTVLSSTSYTTTEWLWSATYKRIDARLNTIGIYVPETQPLVYTNFAVALRLPYGFVLTPEAQYQYTLNEFITIKGALEKRVLRRGYIGLTYEENFKSKLRNMGIQLRYDFNYAQLGFTGRYLNNKFSFLEAARGSIMYDKETNYAGFTNSTSIGRSGIVLLPFLDMDCNGHRDEDEPKVSGLKFRINAGRVQPESKDTTIRVHGLEPYNSYFIELNRLSFDNIAWQMKNKTLRVFAEPNMFRLIEVPIAVVGEVTGTVFLAKEGVEQGLGQVFVNIYKNDSLIAKTLSEPDGYFSYIGLAPGYYVARIDTAQLRKINMISSAPLPFTVAITKEGDVVEGLNFTLKSIYDTVKPEQASTQNIDTPAKKVVKTLIKVKATKPKAKPSAVATSRPKNYKPFPSAMMAAKRPVVKPLPLKAKAKKVIKPTKALAPKIEKKDLPADTSTKKKVSVHVDSTPAGIKHKDAPDSVIKVQSKLEVESDTSAAFRGQDTATTIHEIQDSMKVTKDTLTLGQGNPLKARPGLLKNLRKLFSGNRKEEIDTTSTQLSTMKNRLIKK